LDFPAHKKKETQKHSKDQLKEDQEKPQAKKLSTETEDWTQMTNSSIKAQK